MINLLGHFGKRLVKLDHVGRTLDPNAVDMIFSPHRKWPLYGLVFDQEPLMLDWRTFTSFRVKQGNFGFVRDLLFLRCRYDINKPYLRAYFAGNQDNPYALHNVITRLHNDKKCENLTQFPPLRKTARTAPEWETAVADFLKTIRRGDCIFSGSYRDDITSAIRFYDKCQFSHAAVYVGDGNVVDIGPGGASVNPVLSYGADTFMAAYRPRGATEEQGYGAADYALNIPARCRGYAWGKVFLVFLKRHFNLPVARNLPSNTDMLYSNTMELISYVS